MDLTRRAFIGTVVTGVIVKASNPTGGFNHPWVYTPHPAQEAFMNSPENLMFTYGGYIGGSKTIRIPLELRPNGKFIFYNSLDK